MTSLLTALSRCSASSLGSPRFFFFDDGHQLLGAVDPGRMAASRPWVTCWTVASMSSV